MQYSLSNLNAFFILLAMGYSLYVYVNNNKEYEELTEKNNSPIQLITQMKGFFYLNPVLSLSLGITIFSFLGVPPLIGFFAKQMVLSAALDNGYIFLTLVAILTSVISAVYYLNIINQVFFDKPDYYLNPAIADLSMYASIPSKDTKNTFLVESESITYKHDNIILASYLTITISILTLIISLFVLMPQEWLSMANILALIMFNP